MKPKTISICVYTSLCTKSIDKAKITNNHMAFFSFMWIELIILRSKVIPILAKDTASLTGGK